jgi:hypothetical protein
MADRLGLDMSRVSRLCSALERKPLLADTAMRPTARHLRLRITAAGRLPPPGSDRHGNSGTSECWRHALLLRPRPAPTAWR